MTAPSPAQLEREKQKLFLTDAELIRRMGLPEKVGRKFLKEMDADPKKSFPQKLMANRRYWPAVEKWMDDVPLPASNGEVKIGKVYFLASATTIKIGFSTKSRERLRDIRQYHFEKLELLGLVIDAPPQAERAMHKKFRAHKLPHKREWFHRVPEIEEFASAHHLKPWREEML